MGYSLSDDLIAAPNTCELCGSVLGDGGGDAPRDHTAADALRGLAELFAEHPIGVEVIMVRTVEPGAPLACVARRIRRRLTDVHRACVLMARARPDMAASLGVPRLSKQQDMRDV